MSETINDQTRALLIRDLIHAELDLTSIYSKYSLSPTRLAQWALDESNHRTLTGLCVLADIQTQILLSRYRLVAAGNLVELAGNPRKDSSISMETSRKACVDILKLELPRAEVDATFLTPDMHDLFATSLDALHKLINKDETPHDPGDCHDGATQD